VNYLLRVRAKELNDFEREHADDGVVLQSKLNPDGRSQFVAPRHLHDRVKALLLDSAVVKKTILSAMKSVGSSTHEWDKEAQTHGCLLVIEPSAAPSTDSPPLTTVSVSSGSIHVSTVDITTQQVTISKDQDGSSI
jgi:hypothetical protein